MAGLTGQEIPVMGNQLPCRLPAADNINFLLHFYYVLSIEMISLEAEALCFCGSYHVVKMSLAFIDIMYW